MLLGNERLFLEEFNLVANKRVGLITNHSGLNATLEPTADRLHAHPHTQLVALFGPEHGIRGDAADGAAVGHARDRRTGIPAHSLYGEHRQPSADQLAALDVLLFDIQDVGARFYTYLYTMSLSMQACAACGVPFVVLDRPNPLSGERLEGNVLDPAFASFVGRYPIPIRYAMTAGELALLFNKQFDIGADLHVVQLQGWQRSTYWDQTALPWPPPSPNMPSFDTALVYPGMCFFEGTNVSEGRGTCKPFEQIGAPYIDGPRLSDHLNQLNLPGVLFRPVFFQPTFGKYLNETCQGVQLHVFDRALFQAVRTGFTALNAVRRLYPGEFAWRIPQGGIHNFDRLAGTDQIRLALDAGTSVDDLMATWEPSLETFDLLRRRYLLY